VAVLEIVQIEGLGVLAAGRHRDNPGARRSTKQGDETSDESERPDDERCEGRLDAVRAERPLREDGARVVDEDSSSATTVLG
jgi:hypothetical protein